MSNRTPNHAGLTRTQLMDTLRIGDRTVTLWRQSGLLAPQGGLYAIGPINDLLAAKAYNFAAPPTLDDIESGKLRLLLLQEVLDYFDFEPRVPHGRETLMNRVLKDGVLAAIQLGEHWRFSEASVKAYKKAYLRSRELHISRRDAANILGITKRTLIAQVIETGKVAMASTSLEGRQMRPLLLDSFMALLRELLPSYITPEEWIALRFASRRPLLTGPRANDLLGFDRHGDRLRNLFDEQELRYIHTPGGSAGQRRVLITFESVKAHLDQWPVLTDEQLGQVFVVPITTIRTWRRAGHLACRLHPWHGLALRKACVIGILREWLTGRISGRIWYHGRLMGNSSESVALDEGQAAAMLGCTTARIRQRAETGDLKGLHLPDDTWRFSHEQIIIARRG